jgi:hypothetical protein
MRKQNILIDLLHNKGIFINKTLNNRLSVNEFKTLFLTSIIFFAVYGLLIGINHSFLQAITSSVKVPVLFIFSILISFPTLYFFLAILGLKQNFYQLASFVLVCLTIISGVLIVFAPISLFFLITTTNYYFFKILNVGIFAIAGFVGIYTFYKNIDIVIKRTSEIANIKRLRMFLKLWLLMFGFIGAQLSYTLSPFFGDPSKEFIFFTTIQNNFFSDLLDSIFKFIG